MKEVWQRLELRIDALGLRERTMAFAVAALVLVVLINTVILDPLLDKQRKLSEKVKLDQQQIAAMQTEIQARVKTSELDPDALNRARLQHLKQRSAKLREEMVGMQKGLVSPDKMASLLEDLLRQNGRLQLTSVKTLPATILNPTGPTDQKAGEKVALATAAAAAQKDKTEPKPAGEAVYTHGVELVVQGTYPDILNYLAQLESMPWQLFWAKAKLQTDAYPKATLTLTLFTLSLDKKWLNI
jgi:MSHA biogenesis protein MshJ